MWLALLLLSALPSTAPAAAPVERADLKGVVKADTGEPIANATVLIFTAQPRKGVSTVCPSCYIDCWRRTTTDAEGRFTIDKVDASLVYRVGAVTPAHEPSFANKVDPLAAEAEISLWPKAPLPDDAKRVFRGQVVDLDGRPVAHAVLSPRGFETENGGSYGTIPGLPALTLTDDKGAFSMAAGKDVEGRLLLEMSARGFSTTIGSLPPALEEQKVAIGPGAAVRGRVMKDGKPVPGVTLGIAQVSRASGRFVGEYTAPTNEEGRFILANTIPRDLTVLYSKMAECGKYGAVPIKYVETPDHGGVIDVGDLNVVPAPRLTGTLVLPEGETLPAESTVTVGRPNAWDHVTLPVAADGTFVVEGLPNEPVSLSLGARGYQFARSNIGVDNRGRSVMIAPLERDRDLTLTIERTAAKATPAK